MCIHAKIWLIFVASLRTSCPQVVLAWLMQSCQQVWNQLQKACYNIAMLLQPCIVKVQTFLLHYSKKGATIPIHQIFSAIEAVSLHCLKPRGSHPLKSDDWKTTWYLYLLSFRNAAKKIYQIATNMFSVIKQVFFFKKGSGGNERNREATSPWFGRYRCHQKVDGWVVALAWRNLG